MKPVGPTALALAAVLLTALAPGAAADLASCAAIASAEARLACYDALSAKPAAAPAAPPAQSAPAPAPAAARPAPAPPATAPVTAPPVAAAPAAKAPPAGAPDASTFGFTPAQLKVAPEGPDSITVHIAKLSTDRLNVTTIVFDNGQTWQAVDHDLRADVGDLVTVKRGSLGSFVMKTPSRYVYHVRRLQ